MLLWAFFLASVFGMEWAAGAIQWHRALLFDAQRNWEAACDRRMIRLVEEIDLSRRSDLLHRSYQLERAAERRRQAAGESDAFLERYLRLLPKKR